MSSTKANLKESIGTAAGVVILGSGFFMISGPDGDFKVQHTSNATEALAELATLTQRIENISTSWNVYMQLGYLTSVGKESLPTQLNRYMEILCDDQDLYTTVYNHQKSPDVWLHAFPFGLHNVFQEKANYQLHYGLILHDWLKGFKSQYGKCMLSILFPNCLDVAIVESGRLILLNRFSLDSVSDILYYLMFTGIQSGWKAAKEPLYIAGWHKEAIKISEQLGVFSKFLHAERLNEKAETCLQWAKQGFNK